MKNRLILTLISIAALAGGAIYGRAQRAPQNLLPLRLTPSLVSILRMINWVALNEGIYRKNGLDVDQCMPQNDVDELKEALRIDAPTQYRCKPNGPASPIGLSGGQPAFMGHFASNNPTPRKRVILATIQDRTNYVMFARKDITVPEQLRGKRLAITSRTNILGFQALLFCRAMGWEPDKDITFVIDPSGMNDGLISGKFDAYIAGEGLPLWQATQAGQKPLIEFKYWKVPMASSSVHVEEAWLQNNRETARRFVKSMVDTIAVVKQDKLAFFRALAKYYNIKDPRMQEFFYNTWEFPAKPYPAVEGLRMAKVLFDGQPGLRLDDFRKARVEDYIDDSFVRELDQSGYIDSLYKKK
jgi:ABC-type nitrate/sulfonate/bicarbonate transport system substrate-binding protein